MTARSGRHKAVCAVLWILLGAVVLFIFSQSMKSREESSLESLLVLQWLEPVLNALFGTASEHLVRKLAHFTEFFVLGAVMGGLLTCHRKRNFHMALHALFFGLLCAAADETIQIWSDRGSALPDVWLDFAGCTAGLGVVCATAALLCRRRK